MVENCGYRSWLLSIPQPFTNLPLMPKPTRRVILLGASNLTRSFATVVETAQFLWQEPLEIMAAMGHGRSFGKDSSLFGKKISGIFSCPLWENLSARPPLPTVALVTDIGNDLLYEVPIEQLQTWIDGCLNHLTAAGAQTIVTQLPTANLQRLPEARFQFFRTLFYPRCRLTLSQVRRSAEEVREWLISTGKKTETPVIEALSEWYGLDPIHLKRGVWHVAWPAILSFWKGVHPLSELPRTSLWQGAYLHALTPQERSFFGIPRVSKQPSGMLRDGTTISLF